VPPSPTLHEAIELLDQLSANPSTGLPEELFLLVSRLTPLINVDLLIQVPDRGTLLTWRSDRHYGDGWHIPGGIIRYKETARQRIHEVARIELGATVEFDPAPIAVIESIAEERDRGHFISLLYRCRLTSDPDPRRKAATDPPEPGAWRWHTSFPADMLRVHQPFRRFIEA
jgi:ADP-ribose pyrophosphatase YjhB (NUDIX family)